MSSCGSQLALRAVVDIGSQGNFITTKAVQLLGLKRSRERTYFKGISDQTTKHAKGKVELSFSSSINPTVSLKIVATVLDKICDPLPASALDKSYPDRFHNLKLADETFHVPGNIDMLLGSAVYAQIPPDVNCDIVRHQGIIAQSSQLGYLIMGSISSSNNQATTLLAIDEKLTRAVERFWDSEEVETVNSINPEETEAEVLYKATTKRDFDGRYVVRLPFRKDAVVLSKNRFSPLAGYLNLEKRLKIANEEKLYHDYFQGLLEDGLMAVASIKSGYLLPHHGVKKVDKGTIKIRPVFNGSAPDKNGNSLNQQLLSGPTLHSDIAMVLLNFRLHSVPFICDIKRMYNAVMVAPEDRVYQQVLWRSGENNPVQQFEMNCVTFGLKPSAYLAMRSVQQLVIDEGCGFPLAAEVLKTSIYVDDVIVSCPTLEIARSTQSELIGLLNKGRFVLHKFSSPYSELASPNVDPDIDLGFTERLTKVLGLMWNSDEDSFCYRVADFGVTVTKRKILSFLAGIFDINGFISPVTTFIKKFLQDLWIAGLDWDDPVNGMLQQRWCFFVQDIGELKTIKIPRYIPVSSCVKVDLIGFADASAHAHSAAIYLRCVFSDQAQLYLLRAKSKVNSLKPVVTIPRAELSGALLLVRLYNHLKPFIEKVNIDQTVFCSDSTIGLAWLRIPSHDLKPYVANRVDKILRYSKISWWHFVRSQQNCADINSRGLTPKQFLRCKLWWQGPEFLQKVDVCWEEIPQGRSDVSEEVSREVKTDHRILLTNISCLDTPLDIIERFSSLKRLLRVLGWVRRFLFNARTFRFVQKAKRHEPFLSVMEISEAMQIAVSIVQMQSFPYLFAKHIKKIPKSIRSLTPFVNEKGELRVGGRLKQAPLPYNAKHPLLLPRDSQLSWHICVDTHKRTLHGDQQLMRSVILSQFWILGLNSMVKRVVRNCLSCVRYTVKPTNPLMADLPAYRFNTFRPFDETGMDVTGSFIVHESSRPRSKLIKVYIILFTCLSTRASHVEILPDLSANAFVSSLQCFVDRRGLVRAIHCDNATNFHGGSRMLKEIRNFLVCHGDDISRSLAINIRFISPASPFKGGAWERLIGLIKSHLIRSVGNRNLTYNEFSELVVRIEAMLNSRPLIPPCADPNDGILLTPGHFLVGGSLLSLPELPLDPDTKLLARWQVVKSCSVNFWKWWKEYYLNKLMPRAKWNETIPNVEVGDIVIMRGDNTPPAVWPVGVVHEALPHSDGTVRVVTIKTNFGIYTRPVQKLIKFPQE